MEIYAAGETITRRLLDLPIEQAEWIITGADRAEVIAAGFEPHATDETRFIHAESGDVYQLARRQYLDEKSGLLKYQCDHGITLENELATRPLTILAMASEADDIIDPFDGQQDLIEAVLRHVTPYYANVPMHLLTTAVWAARLRVWGFRIAHGTFKLMKKIVAAGGVSEIPQQAVTGAVLQAMSSPRPSEFFRVLHRCGALDRISHQLAALFENRDAHSADELPEKMQSLDRIVAETDNLASVIKRFYDLLEDDSYKVFNDLGLASLSDTGVISGD